ncbi:acetolactate synthase large subunit [Sphingosinicella sp.]|uniref:acetolactate synthase large subunit n=1 Tax=Sphingosinicella sp. TaxID=1917971 RepID=UPI00185099F3|nr:acetolactate synthase large subunit [Sphingosinicella sp.]MBA4760038.1 acetolactate synthase large subunit [Sphingosinicella sp.]
MDAQISTQLGTPRLGADLLLDSLYNAGARICFANPGTTELGLVSALSRDGRLRCVLSLFEGVCTGAADGYARVSGEVPLTLLHLGPGFANGIANLHNARRAGSRIINLIGDHATWHLAYDAPLTSDIHSLASPVSREVIYIDQPESIADSVIRAFAATNLAEGGAATLVIPTDVVDAPAPARGDQVGVAPYRPEPVERATIEAAADALVEPGAFIVLLGGNALTEAGIRAGAKLAARLGGRLLMEPYPPIVTLGGDLPVVERQAYFPDDVMAQMGGAKVVLAGARMPISYFGYEGYPSQLVPDERLVRLAAPGEDALAALEALGEALGAGDVPLRPTETPLQSGEPQAALSPASVVEELLVQLPEDAIISLEGSTLGGPWLRNAHRARRHRVMTNTGGAIGQGLPCAVGAALAAPQARVVSLQSDGSAQYTLQSLWTMAREGLKVTVIMAANHRYAILQTELTRAAAPLDDAVIASLTRLDQPRVDWVALAQGYGVEAVRVTTNAELAAALKKGLALDGPLLIQAELP